MYDEQEEGGSVMFVSQGSRYFFSPSMNYDVANGRGTFGSKITVKFSFTIETGIILVLYNYNYHLFNPSNFKHEFSSLTDIRESLCG